MISGGLRWSAVIVLASAWLLCGAAASGQDTGRGARHDPPAGVMAPPDSDAAAFRDAVRRLTSPEFERRKERRLAFQRRGYASILHEFLRRRALGAFIAMLRTKAQLDMHLPQNTLYVRVPVRSSPPADPRLQIFSPPSSPPMALPLIEDRRFPEDPWRK